MSNSIRIQNRISTFAWWLLGGLTLATPHGALADFTVFPTRLEMSDTKRVGNLSVRQNDDKTGNYTVTATFFRMQPNGAMEKVENPKPEERPLGKYLRFSPRQLTLAPHTEQIIRVMYAGPANLPEGDYRAHLHIVPADPPAPPEPTEKKAEGETNGEGEKKTTAEDKDAASKEDEKKDKKIELKLEARLAFAIPVIFHRGKPKFTIKLENVRVLKSQESAPQVAVDMVWTGNAIPYGDFQVSFGAKNEKPAVIGLARGVGAYISPRTVTVPLTLAREKLKDGTLRIDFQETQDAGGKVIQSTEVKLP